MLSLRVRSSALSLGSAGAPAGRGRPGQIARESTTPTIVVTAPASLDLASDDCWIGAEAPPPQSVADHSYGRGARGVVSRSEKPSGQRPRLHDGEEVFQSQKAGNPLRCPFARQVGQLSQ